MTEKHPPQPIEPPEKPGLAQWLKRRILGKEQDALVPPAAVEDAELPESVGRYVIRGILGQGSMGVVYLATDPYIQRTVAIKVSRSTIGATGDKANSFRQRFFLEAQSAGRLSHPNIVAIYDAGIYRNSYYITMEYIDGHTLERFCTQGALLPVRKVLEILYVACRALDYAHRKGIVHRDIKPSNIMLTDTGTVKITDFGIAHIKSEGTMTMGIVGSPSYMSPEQVKEENLDQRSDIFSTGCVLYELLTGEKAFPGDQYYSILYRIAQEDPKSILEIRGDLPELLWDICRRALAKAPADRYQSCLDFALELRAAIRSIREARSRDTPDTTAELLCGVSFFEDFTPEQVRQILDASSLIKVFSGRVIVTEGQIDDCFYVLLSGGVTVQKGGKDLAVLRRGDCFGEMAYLSSRAREATVVAQTDCILLKISATLLDASPESLQILFLRKFALTLVQRLSRAQKASTGAGAPKTTE
ncbi:MAG TPA: serine/threonine-protein kinase [Syntrophobacteraceae bacterium]|nr:serine/threonine-protein kinase [Syntrophobacteraceae bacterium]